MGTPCKVQRFDVADALLALDELSEAAHYRPLPGLGAAWEAAWIACLTHSSAWAVVAEAAFRQVLGEFADDPTPRGQAGSDVARLFERWGACRCALA